MLQSYIIYTSFILFPYSFAVSFHLCISHFIMRKNIVMGDILIRHRKITLLSPILQTFSLSFTLTFCVISCHSLSFRAKCLKW